MNVQRLVWAPNPIDALGGATGFVTCDGELAASLLEANLVDDPKQGMTGLRRIDMTRSVEYGHKMMTAALAPAKAAPIVPAGRTHQNSKKGR